MENKYKEITFETIYFIKQINNNKTQTRLHLFGRSQFDRWVKMLR